MGKNKARQKEYNTKKKTTKKQKKQHCDWWAR